MTSDTAETDNSGLLALQQSAVTEVQRLVDGVQPAQLGLPTPCRDWDVQTLLGHLVAGNQRFAGAASGGSLTGMGDTSAPDADRAAYAESARTVTEAWLVPAALEQEHGAMNLTVHLIECALHGWDLARASGQQPSFDERILDVVEPFAHKMMPADRPPGFGFDPEKPAPDGASRLDRLAAFYGRDV